MKKNETIYLALGSNLGASFILLKKAISLLEQRVGQILAIAPFWETEPWGFYSANNFINTCVEMRTNYTPQKLLILTQEIEKELGRTHKHLENENYSDRTIDIDILFYGNSILNLSELKIPHTLLHKRFFVLDPLCTIAPLLVHPLLNKTIVELHKDLNKNKIQDHQQ